MPDTFDSGDPRLQELLEQQSERELSAEELEELAALLHAAGRTDEAVQAETRAAQIGPTAAEPAGVPPLEAPQGVPPVEPGLGVPPGGPAAGIPQVPPAYGQMGPAVAGPQTNILSILSLLFGLMGLLGCLLTPLLCLTVPAALITGGLGLMQVNQSDGLQTGKGLAIAGMALAGVEIVLTVLQILLAVVISSV